MTSTQCTEALAALFASKYAEAIANGATDEQAINACRSLWLEAAAA